MAPVAVASTLVAFFSASLASPVHAAARNAPVTASRDWSGVWMLQGGLSFDPTTLERGEEVKDRGSTFGIGPLAREHPPYNAEWELKYEAVLKMHRDGVNGDPMGNCATAGMPRLMGGAPGPTEVIVTPSKIWMIWEFFNETRRIRMDGKGHPGDLWPTLIGDSTGRWDGDTLAIDTVSMKAGIFDRTEAPHSDKIHVVERMRRLDQDTIENQIEVTDPVAFTHPWRITRQFKRMPDDMRFLETYCENNRNPIIDGQTQVILPTDKPGYFAPGSIGK
jgi:hypothetical protein